MLSECTQLAANLSSSYFSNATYYNGQESLVDFLTTTGVLISMCLSETCTTTTIDHHPTNKYEAAPLPLSGSWLQQSTTGPRVFGSSGVGMVLDPRLVDIQCVYPLDAATVGRDDNGCGPIIDDDSTFPTWFDRHAMKIQVYWRKWWHFRHADWKDIPCSKFLAPFDNHDDDDDDDLSSVIGMMDHNQTWATFGTLLKKDVENVLGHVVCHDDLSPHFTDVANDMLLYTGNEPWKPSEWSDAAAVTLIVTEQHPKMDIWNEIVMSHIQDVTEYEEIVRAIFFIGKENRDRTLKEAKALGGKHVLEFLPHQNEKDIFRCLDVAVNNNDDEPEVIPVTKSSVSLLRQNDLHRVARTNHHERLKMLRAKLIKKLTIRRFLNGV